MKYLGIALVYGYRWLIALCCPQARASSIRSCSQYAIDALKKYGLLVPGRAPAAALPSVESRWTTREHLRDREHLDLTSSATSSTGSTTRSDCPGRGRSSR